MRDAKNGNDSFNEDSGSVLGRGSDRATLQEDEARELVYDDQALLMTGGLRRLKFGDEVKGDDFPGE